VSLNLRCRDKATENGGKIASSEVMYGLGFVYLGKAERREGGGEGEVPPGGIFDTVPTHCLCSACHGDNSLSGWRPFPLLKRTQQDNSTILPAVGRTE
jgi:rubredoxin